jgi:aspartate/methionine/tyrosine aminotransferase
VTLTRLVMKIDPFKLERYFAQHEFTAPHILCSSDSESLSIQELLNMESGSEHKLKSLTLGYTEAPGSPELREQIAGLYENITPSEVLVFAGAEEGIFVTMNALLDKGDHVVAEFPAYQSLYEVPRAVGCDVSKWNLREQEKWSPDLSFLSSAIKSNTKAIIVNHPHNPTGYQMSPPDFNELISIARNAGAHLFSDEVYRFSEYDAKDRLPAAADAYEKGVSLGVMSKTFGLAGLRIGWIATKDKTLLQRAAAFKDYTTICSSAPSEFLATIALRNKDAIIKRNLEIIKVNISILESFMARHSTMMSWVQPKAGPVAFPQLKEGNTERFCKDLVNKKGVLLLPSSRYDGGDSNFRIGFGRKNMPRVLKLLEEHIS